MRDRRMMRDRAVGSRMMDRMRGDRRNPYGSRGGYVVSDKRGDMPRGRMADRYERDRTGDYRDYGSENATARRDYRGRDGHYDDYEYDMMGGRDYDDYRDYGYDYGEYRRDYGEDAYEISKRDMNEWKRDLVNSDGSHGEHFAAEKILNAANQMGVRFDKYTDKDFVMTANMLYSDYGKTLKTVVPPDREAHIYAALAKDFLEDEDSALEGSEKLAVYYNCVVKDE